MDQKRLLLFVALSAAILFGWQAIAPKRAVPPPVTVTQSELPPQSPATTGEGGPATGAVATTDAPATPREVPRLKIAAPKLAGSMSLLGARLDDVTLLDYRETLAADSPLVRLLGSKDSAHPYFVQYGWTAPAGVTVPGDDTIWAASGTELRPDRPVTLSWDNGAGLHFEIALAVDQDYLFTVDQRVRNTGGTAAEVFPFARIRRDYTPELSGFSVLFEGLLGQFGGKLQEASYTSATAESEKNAGIAVGAASDTGWAGITDKYWLTALTPDKDAVGPFTFRLLSPTKDHYQADLRQDGARPVAPGATGSLTSRTFAGAKIVPLLDRYESTFSIPNFNHAVDWGWFPFFTQPIFYALDWLDGILGNFGLAILVFTVGVKALFFPLASYSYRSMSKMKLLGPKMTTIRERHKDDPAKMQSEIMGMYKAEGVNPVSGCLPMLIQIPVFFSLYKVIVITIDLRQAPFYGWINDLSQVDPTNIFNLFGLLPFNPATILPFLHMGLLPLLMGLTMYAQQKLNPPPPDPVQAKLFQFMPVVFTFMMAGFPAGLILYWTWNNLLSILQQWFIMRRSRLSGVAVPG